MYEQDEQKLAPLLFCILFHIQEQKLRAATRRIPDLYRFILAP